MTISFLLVNLIIRSTLVNEVISLEGLSHSCISGTVCFEAIYLIGHISWGFLFAYKRLYYWLCRSVRRLVCRSVRRLVTLMKLLPKSYLQSIIAPDPPAHESCCRVYGLSWKRPVDSLTLGQFLLQATRKVAAAVQPQVSKHHWMILPNYRLFLDVLVLEIFRRYQLASDNLLNKQE